MKKGLNETKRNNDQLNVTGNLTIKNLSLHAHIDEFVLKWDT